MTTVTAPDSPARVGQRVRKKSKRYEEFVTGGSASANSSMDSADSSDDMPSLALKTTESILKVESVNGLNQIIMD